MARIYPFRALRYNSSLVRLDDVVTQPYDKITPSMQQAYYQRSPYNLVRIILGLPDLFDQENTDVYSRAAAEFTSWRQKELLLEEKEPAIFSYSQRFRLPGEDRFRERKGFIALGELYDYSQGVVFRHEETLSTPLEDRLNLLRATRAHFGQIFMLYSDPARSIEQLLSAATPEVEVTDEYGVQHRLSRISSPSTINLLLTAMEDKKLILADGHHRYEAALQYSKQFEASADKVQEHSPDELPRPPFPERVAMMTFVNMDAEEVVILPTHRAVSGLADFRPEQFLEALSPYFVCSRMEAADAAAIVSTLGASARPSFVALTRLGAWLLQTKPEALVNELGDISPRQRRLELVQLHTLILEKILHISAEDVRKGRHLRYLRDAGEAVEQLRGGKADIVFLMNPVSLEQLREIAFAGELMPQKSTDFYPKLLSGLTIYALE